MAFAPVAQLDQCFAERGRAAFAKHRQKRPHRRPEIGSNPERHRRAPSDMIELAVHLDDRPPVGEEFVIGKIGAQHHQHVAIGHRMQPRRVADIASHANDRTFDRLEHLLAAQRMGDRRADAFGQCPHILAGPARVCRHRG